MNIKKYFIENYISKFSESDYIGVEIEMAIINSVTPYIVDKKVVQELFLKLLNYDFVIENYDNDKNITSIKNKNTYDTISLEYSFNTIELSLSKELSIFKLQDKFEKYYRIITKQLKKYNYEIYCGGINPNYKYIERNSLNQDRYKVIERLLSKGSKNMLYNQFCSYCCSIQTHINVSKENIVNLINVLSKIENNKSDLFSNSYMKEINKKNSRKYLWENSNFGPLNVGPNSNYKSLDQLINDYLKRNLFFVKRENRYLLFDKKQPLNKYFSKKRIKCTDSNRKTYYVVPSYSDFDDFRSYKSVELTRYGTLEIRTDCTQSKNNIFRLVAFNVGICKNYEKVLECLNKKGTITNKELINICINGLKNRNYGEEKYMEENMERKKVGIWMYENDNGINIKKKIVSILEKKGYEVCSDFDMRECYVKDGKVYTKENYCLSDVDIFYHMNADEQNQYQNDILRLLELSGVHVFNDYNSFIYCKDKVISNLLLRKNSILVPPSMLINNKLKKDDLKKIIDEWGTVIVKPRTNHGGKGIVKIDNYELFCDFYEATKTFTQDYYLEKYIPFEDHDYRVEIFDGEVIGTYCRGKCGTYKTNISSGGSMENIKVPDEFKTIALKAAKTLNITTTIVDMILSSEDKQIYVLEVNPIMGIFLEEGMKAGTKMPIQSKIPKSFKTDKIKIDKIINYIENYLERV